MSNARLCRVSRSLGRNIYSPRIILLIFLPAVPRAALSITGRLEAAGRADASITAVGTTSINMGVRFVRDGNR